MLSEIFGEQQSKHLACCIMKLSGAWSKFEISDVRVFMLKKQNKQTNKNHHQPCSAAQ
jgi:hypothetical protein